VFLGGGDILIWVENTKWARVNYQIPQAGVFRQHIKDGEIIGSKLAAALTIGTLTTTNDITANGVNLNTTLAANTTAIAGKQATIGDGDLTIARTSGLQTAIDSKQATLTAGTNLYISESTINVGSAPGIGNSVARFAGQTSAKY